MSSVFGIQPKPFASLSSGLLARKGQARPAMRPQGYSSLSSLSHAGNELGWNDMGHAEPEAPVPPVLVVREALKEEIEAPAVVLPILAPAPVAAEPLDVSVLTAARIQRETQHKTRAAFTLRLDEARHLRLRLASATRRRSAQLLVTEALDAFLATLPEVEALVAQLPPPKTR